MTLNLPLVVIQVDSGDPPFDLDPQAGSIIKIYSEHGGGTINLLPIDPPDESLDGLFLQFQSWSFVGNITLQPKDPAKMNNTPQIQLSPFVAVDVIYSYRENKWLVGKFL